ncbi:glycosyl transferase [Nostoc sp. 'Peltigera membranacea cyanobiont' 213]|uniref:glycosyltransferase family 2 protein n=1 Tax=Nostoc sp. 'Peltigera membranacea cyanobiont' 213 TaxID=2014530 RepID=UPI000B952492|nr:glycosyltransferase family 2 protein [Nostoc sp. 'Peltigera membranacea cyanobiont' 213]OYD95951.1 glycosyl transferase [Nostoc sp. 'Peltigera membranacea cyanobiont' 213]
MSFFQEYQQPLVSVIIPTYNRPEYLKQAIASAIQQTYQNIEIIISDNCSEEDTQAIVASFADLRIRFWRHEQNVGMLANQQHAFKMAQGKYVASLHDDDMWNEDFLAKLIPPLEENPDLIIAFCDQYIIDANGIINNLGTEENTRGYKRDKLAKGIHQPFYKIGLIDKSIPTAASCVIRNKFVDWDSIPSEVGGMWDLYLTYLCSISGHAAYYYPERLTRYRAHEQTDTMLSGSRDVQAKIRKAKSEMFCYQVFMEDTRLQQFRNYFQQKWLEANTTFGIGLLRSEQIAAARSYFWQTLRRQKFNTRTIVALSLSFTPEILANKLIKMSKE